MNKRAAGRAALREGSRDLAKIIRDADCGIKIGKSEVRIDLSRNYEFGTKLDDPIVIYSISGTLL